ncbi:hypothetical protein [Aliiroseovarius crassostreae]|uniref:hypothetical protein n=1 Tax=Aliiroseovarius crassostreae TaxID=154981 RepID=UPI00220F53E1|nr:hypothetical protein [Aliiroseovarius crassostreae]UWQ08834.1 hypothetical protein K3X25_04430 [Aliiroseovarius crassostreae]
MDPTGNDAFSLDLGVLGGTIGMDVDGAWGSIRVGIVGAGAVVAPDASFSRNNEVHNKVGNCEDCAASGYMESINVVAGVAAGVGIAGIDYDIEDLHDEFGSIYNDQGERIGSYRDNSIDGTEDGRTGPQDVQYSPPDTGASSEKKTQSPKDASKHPRIIGLRIKLGAYFEFGKKESWDQINPNVESYRLSEDENEDLDDE